LPGLAIGSFRRLSQRKGRRKQREQGYGLGHHTQAGRKAGQNGFIPSCIH